MKPSDLYFSQDFKKKKRYERPDSFHLLFTQSETLNSDRCFRLPLTATILVVL